MSRARDIDASDLDRGDALLDRLTHYLRTTLGGAARDGCTLGREAAIAAARIEVECVDGASTVAIDIPAPLAGRPFSPDLLSRLAHDWLAEAGAAALPVLGFRAAEAACTLRVTVFGPCPVPAKTHARCALAISTFTSSRGAVRSAGARLHLELTDAEA